EGVTRTWITNVTQEEFDTLGDDDLLRIARQNARPAQEVVDRAKLAHATYIKDSAPTRATQEDIARHALRLARLDPVYRAGHLDQSTFEDAAPEDVQDLLAMLALVPFDLLIHDKVLLLNPTFGESSHLVGGADVDLITGDMLLDFKATKASKMECTYLDQILGYLLLARNQRRLDPAFPEIKRLGLYFCRHGHLWTQDAAVWTERPEFAALEGWFFQHA